MPINQLPILVYHYFGRDRTPQPGMKSWDTAYITLTEQFRAHCVYLRDNGYQPVPLQAVVAAVESAQPLPPKPIVITIDDGHESVMTHAVPILAEFHFPAELFVIPTKVGEPGYLNWGALRNSKSMNMALQSHGLTHRRLTSLDNDEIRHELAESKRLIETESRQDVIALAAPMGRYPKGLGHHLTASGYKVGLTSVYGHNAPVNSLLLLQRIMIKAPHDTTESLQALLDPSSALSRRMRWRNLAKRVRAILLG